MDGKVVPVSFIVSRVSGGCHSYTVRAVYADDGVVKATEAIRCGDMGFWDMDGFYLCSEAMRKLVADIEKATGGRVVVVSEFDAGYFSENLYSEAYEKASYEVMAWYRVFNKVYGKIISYLDALSDAMREMGFEPYMINRYINEDGAVIVEQDYKAVRRPEHDNPVQVRVQVVVDPNIPKVVGVEVYSIRYVGVLRAIREKAVELLAGFFGKNSST